ASRKWRGRCSALLLLEDLQDRQERDRDAHQALARDEAGRDGDGVLLGELGLAPGELVGDERANEERDRVEAVDREGEAEPGRRRDEAYVLREPALEEREQDAEERADDEADARGRMERLGPLGEQLGDAAPDERCRRRPALGREQVDVRDEDEEGGHDDEAAGEDAGELRQEL